MATKVMARPDAGPPEGLSEYGGNGSSTIGTSRPGISAMEASSAAAAASAIASVPMLAPPSSITGASAGESVTATWRTNQRVIGLWSIDEVRNMWINVEGLGWRKLFNGRDGAFAALATLASQARQTGRLISIREEADGMIYEIYLW